MKQTIIFSIFIIAFVFTSPSYTDNSLGREHTSLTRLKEERLEATRQDVQRLHSSRTKLDALSPTYTDLGLQDFRATFHTHAGDSAHTGGTPEEFLEAAKSVGLDIAFLQMKLISPN